MPARPKSAAGASAEHPLAFCACPRCGCVSRSSSGRPAALSAVQSFADPAFDCASRPAAGRDRSPQASSPASCCAALLRDGGGQPSSPRGSERLERTIAATCLLGAALLLFLASLPAAPNLLAAAAVAAANQLQHRLPALARHADQRRRAAGRRQTRLRLRVSGLDLGFALARAGVPAPSSATARPRAYSSSASLAWWRRGVGRAGERANSRRGQPHGENGRLFLACAKSAGHLLVEALVAQGIGTVRRSRRNYLAVLDGFHEHRERIRFVACRQEAARPSCGRGAGPS